MKKHNIAGIWCYGEDEIKVVLELDEEETTWLRGIVENSLGEPSEETDEDKKMRLKFWDALIDVNPS